MTSTQLTQEAIAETLNAFHAAAAASDEEAYFSSFAAQGRFLGTDASENWTVEEFRRYAKPAFDTGSGWVYRPVRRTIDSMDSIAWFDEHLESEKWGPARGTGVMRQEGEAWKILQYHLSFPVPNELANEITSIILQNNVETRAKDT
jgi:hypothetical protein